MGDFLDIFRGLGLLIAVAMGAYFVSRKKKPRPGSASGSKGLAPDSPGPYPYPGGTASRSAGASGPKPGGRFERYGYSVELSDDYGVEKQSGIPADLRAVNSGGDYFFAIPICLFGTGPSLEAVSAGLLEFFDISIGEQNLQVVGDLNDMPGMQGYEFLHERKVEDQDSPWVFTLRVYRGEDFAYLFAGVATDGGDRKRSVAPFETIRLSPATRIENLSETESTRHGRVFNQIGLHYYANGDVRASLDYFQRSFEFNSNEAVVVTNLALVLERLEKTAEALELLRDRCSAQEFSLEKIAGMADGEGKFKDVMENARKERLDAVLPVHARLGILENRFGNEARAREILQGIFSNHAGFTHDEALIEYVSSVESTEGFDKARDIGIKYLEQSGSIEVLIALADMHGASGKFDEALELLDRRKQELYFRGDLVFARIRILQAADRFRDCVDFCTEIHERGNQRSGSLYYSRAQAYSALGLYREAKEDLEEARRLSPGTPEIENFLSQVSGMMGEGSNSALKQELEAVPLPPGVEPRDTKEENPDLHYALFARAFAFVPGEELRVTDHRILHIKSYQAAQNFQSLRFPFNSLNEQVFVNKAVVTQTDGTSQSVSPDTMYVMDDGQDEIASYAQLVNIPLPGLNSGSTVELVVTRRRLAAPDSFPFEEMVFASGGSIGSGVCSISGPPDALTSIRGVSFGDVRETRDRDLLSWKVDDVSPLYPEPNLAGPYTFLPILCMSGIQRSWQEEAQEYYESIADKFIRRGEQDDERSDKTDSATEASANLLATIREGMAPEETNDQEALIRAIFEYTRKEIKYMAIEFGVRGRMPNDSALTVTNRYGDCKDMSVLLCNLLTTAGIAARAALVRHGAPVVKELPSLDQFNHMLVVLTDTDRILDPTIKFHGVEIQPPLGTGKKSILVLDEGRFLESPPYGKDSSQMKCARRIEVAAGKDGAYDLLVTERGVMDGYYAAFFRQDLLSLPMAHHHEFLSSRFTREYCEIKSLDALHVEDISRPIEIKIQYLQKGALRAEGDGGILHLPGLIEPGFLQVISAEHRRHPLEYEYGLRITSKSNFSLPEELAHLGVESEGKTAGGNIRSAFELRTENGALTARFACHFLPGVYSVEQCADIARGIEEARAPFHEPFKLEART